MSENTNQEESKKEITMPICPITGTDQYLSQMSLSYFDKMDFMQLIHPDITTIIDFGCADGSLIEILKRSFPQYTYYGVENNPEFAAKAEAKLGDSVKIYPTLRELYEENELDSDKCHLNMGSVIHELFAYEKFPRRMLSDIIKIYDFRSVSIRDMGYFRIPMSKNFGECRNSKNSSSITDYDEHRLYKLNHLNALKNVSIKIMERCLIDDNLRDKLTEYLLCNNTELKTGPVILEFLLKYFYDDNWKRECRETYFVDRNVFFTLHDLFESYDYRCIKRSYYTLPYLLEKWKNDFKFNKNDLAILSTMTTHKKLFYQKLSDEEMVIKYHENGSVKNHNPFMIHPMISGTGYVELDFEDYLYDSVDDGMDEAVPLESASEAEPVYDESARRRRQERDEWNFRNGFIQERQRRLQEIAHNRVNDFQRSINTILERTASQSIDERYMTTSRFRDYLNAQRMGDPIVPFSERVDSDQTVGSSLRRF